VTYFLDTNIFLRVLIREEQQSHDECLSLLKAVKAGHVRAVTSDIVLAEVAWTLSSYYQFSREKTAQALESIIQLRNLQFTSPPDRFLTVQLYRQQPVKYIDAAIAALPQLQSQAWELISYDKDFDRLSVRRCVPSEVVKNS